MQRDHDPNQPYTAIALTQKVMYQMHGDDHDHNLIVVQLKTATHSRYCNNARSQVHTCHTNLTCTGKPLCPCVCMQLESGLLNVGTPAVDQILQRKLLDI